jgi:GntR family transcriptional regulator
LNSSPKYYQFSNDIIAKIRDGSFLPGMKIPSENEIIGRYRVSNTTARKILQRIESAGLATRVKGKGTYVNSYNIKRSANRILSFTRNMLESGHTPATEVLDARTIDKGYSSTINGRRYSIQGPAFKVRRLRFADDTPILLETRYISVALCPGIQERDFEGSLYDMYHHYGHRLTEIDQMLSTCMIGAGLKEFFDVSGPAPAFRLESVTFCEKEMVLEIEDSIYRGDKYRFAVRALPQAHPFP